MTRMQGIASAVHLLSVYFFRAGALHVGSPDSGAALRQNPYEVHYGACSCDLRELECLPSKECVQVVMAASDELVAGGIEIRRAFKKKYMRAKPGVAAERRAWQQVHLLPNHPMGKVVTYSAITNWMRWISGRELMLSYHDTTYSKFIDASRYPECRKKKLSGSKCFWKDFADYDDYEDLGNIEISAVKRRKGKQGKRAAGLGGATTNRLEQFRASALRAITGGTDGGLKSLSADDFLLSMAHIARTQFNLRRGLREAYERSVSVVNPGVGKLRVGVHVRRADSCSVLNEHGYMQEPSPIDTHAQTTNVRLCYHTNVYVKMLRRIRDLYGMPLAVYLSSDDAGSILDEMKSLGPDIFEGSSWHYLHFNRSIFKYSSTIEFQPKEESVFLGESGALDTWHLSHSQMLVGSLGSRFGKAAYLLAVARHNVPIPYMSVDGHNYCCQNDEQCSKATEALTDMADCLTFAPEMFGWRPSKDDKYWTEGVTVRWDRDVSERRLPWNPDLGPERQ